MAVSAHDGVGVLHAPEKVYTQVVVEAVVVQLWEVAVEDKPVDPQEGEEVPEVGEVRPCQR